MDENCNYQFRPAWWLKNKHLQTLYPVFFSNKNKINLISETLILPDGDTLLLDWSENKNQTDKPLLVLLHGLEGSSSSPYIQRLMKQALNLDFRSVCMHFRGCGGVINQQVKSYHAGETEDFKFFLKYLAQKSNFNFVYAVGFSLGGNVLLKYLGENPSSTFIKSAVAVSVPFELADSAESMNKGVSKLYQWWLLRCLKESLIEKGNLEKIGISKAELLGMKNFWEFDDKVTAKINGFINVHDYYKKSSSRQFLNNITTPTLIIHSCDDPFMSPSCIPKPEEISRQVQLELNSNGGHIGFISGKIPFFPEYWLENRIMKYFLK
ncbi:hydrolase [Silvanigrella aquatica]|uniref:AB hydrolase-1 domain-containing protein n=1 Tax=Silvanigrella aquatica TaxID=1915309 RepID=A0A1L4CXZ3_9BACT|nr:hydrolase [Silvanigrella aquatica]APJ02833.1 hypothetical protein AXG55_02415 [Silvanigrella aquatica]